VLTQPRSGILFDIIQCLIQRNMYYATEDVRDCYKIIKSILYDLSKTKVVFILHSQGAIEGGMILDWLLQEVPQDLLAKLEVYTFGNAANHFNNPHMYLHAQRVDTTAAVANSISRTFSLLSAISGGAVNGPVPVNKTSGKTIRHIEHYANSHDPVALLGVLQYTRTSTSILSATAPCFMGRVFARPGYGHQFNQHYLDNMFPLNKERTRALDASEFMDGQVEVDATSGDSGDSKRRKMEENKDCCGDVREGLEQSFRGADPVGRDEEGVELEVEVWDSGSPIVARKMGSWPVKGEEKAGSRLKVGDLSRLWLYRNGGCPPDDI
jgi:hypothetical protein